MTSGVADRLRKAATQTDRDLRTFLAEGHG
jgi:hypothetical protein